MKARAERPGWRRLAAAVLLVAVATTAVPAADEAAIYALRVDGLACPFCAYGVEKQFLAIDGVAAVDIDIGSGTLTVTMHGGATLDEAAARSAVEAAGFSMRDFGRAETGE